jgi:hypothetical protein
MLCTSVLAGAALLAALSGAVAEPATAQLSSFEEVPAISTRATGSFRAGLRNSGFNYKLKYNNLKGNVTQAHIHFAQRGVNGGIVVFLCTNLGNGPEGTPACPGDTDGVVNGSITAALVVAGGNAQGIAAGELTKVLSAIRAGVAYVNVHSDLFPGGEIRGQLQVAQ